jgi:hypothetical protein
MQFVRENLTRAPPKLDEAEAPAVGPGQRSESPDSSV